LGQLTVFGAIDALRPAGLDALVHPLAVGGSIVLFRIWTTARSGKRPEIRAVAGTPLPAAGLTAMAV